MELKGKIIKELPLVEGQGKKGSWAKQDYVLQTEGQYPKSICFSVWGDNIDKLNISLGDEVTVSIELESREYNSKYYTEVRAWKAEHHKFAGPAKTQASGAKQSQAVGNSGPKDDTDDNSLPF